MDRIDDFEKEYIGATESRREEMREIATERIRIRDREAEAEAYKKLVKNGSRPLYSIALLDDVSRKPEEYLELLRPWAQPFRPISWSWGTPLGLPTGYGFLEVDDSGFGPWTVFQRQWARWQIFGIWQRDNRWIQDDDDGFPSYIEFTRDYKKRYPLVSQDVAKELADIEADPSILKDEWWNRSLSRRRKQREICREYHDGAEFADYVNAVKRRLARHGFTRPFELKEDTKQQDNLSTWIEYLGFEYWWLDWWTHVIDDLKPRYDKAWQELTDSKVLLPDETQEYVGTEECSMRRSAELTQARDAEKRAHEIAGQVCTSILLDSNHLSIFNAECCRKIEAANHKLQTASAWLSLTKKRDKLIHEYIHGTWDTRHAKRAVARHRILLAWILEQIPLIEAESGHTEAAQHEPDTAKRTKKRTYPDEDSPFEQNTKKRKFSCSSPSLRLDTSASVMAKNQQLHRDASVEVGNRLQHKSQRPHAEATSALYSAWTLANSSTAPQWPRRSARIAARQTTTGTALISQPFQRELRPRQQNKPNKAP